MNSDQWFRTEEQIENRLIVFIGPTFWIRNCCSKENQDWDFEINIYFKFYDNSIY